MRTVFLDFDGVVYHNTRTHALIQSRSVEFMATKCHVPMKEAVRLNRVNYTAHGHTVLGCPEFPLDEYNTQVFRTFPDFTTKEDIAHINHLLELKTACSFNYVLCTNAPRAYCETVLHRMDIPIGDVFDMCFTSDTVGWVKPMREYYSAVESSWTKGKQSTIRFIDDSPLNIQALNQHPNWLGYLAATPDTVLSSLKTISELDEMCDGPHYVN